MSIASSTTIYTPRCLTADLLAGAGPGTNPNEASVSGTEKMTKMDAVNRKMAVGDLHEKIPALRKELMENGLSSSKRNPDHNLFRKFITPAIFLKAKKYRIEAKLQSSLKKTAMANRPEEVMGLTLNEHERTEEKKKIRFSTELYENLDKLYEDLLTMPPCNEESDPYLFRSNSMPEALSTITNKPLLSCGLPNFESNCYINASLQCLFTAKSFCEELSDLLENASPKANDKFIRYFVTLSRIRNNSEVQSNNELDSVLMGLIKLAARINPEFTISQQNDAHEFLCHCLTQLEESVKKLQKSSQNDVPSRCPVGSNFFFKMRNIIKCSSCEFTRSKMEVFSHISVPPNQNSVELCLHDLLNNPAVLESMCEKCGGKSATSLWTPHNLPKFLILHLNRFKVTEFGTIRKLITPVEITPELQINFLPCLDMPGKESDNAETSETDQNKLVKESPGDTSTEEGKLTYQLISFISHIGRTQYSGHYVTDCSTSNTDQWMSCNDEIITLINKSDILQLGSMNAYVLLYESVSTDTSSSTSEPGASQ